MNRILYDYQFCFQKEGINRYWSLFFKWQNFKRLKWLMVCTAWRVSVFGVILVHNFPYSDWIFSDTMYHSILLGTLSILFFPDNTVKWFQSYLSNGEFSLNFENSFSEISNITCGVPQGYILGIYYSWFMLMIWQ